MNKFNLSDRESIEIGIVRHNSLKRIGVILNKSTSAISREIKKHRIFVPGSYFAGNDCKYAKGCTQRHMCGDERCPMYCYSCTSRNCHEYCKEYETTKCLKYNKPPYACNGCNDRRYCSEDKYFYDAKVADKAAKETRKTASTGPHLNDLELKTINDILFSGLKKGQPMSHIFSTHEMELIVSERTAYRLISNGDLDVRSIDLRRATRYKRRKKRKTDENSVLNQRYRQGRSYQDFLNLMEYKSDYEVVELDTVKGKKGKGKVLLTMLFRRNSIMLIFVMPDCKASSVIDRFDFLEKGLGTECFRRLFGICLTDNGSEFKCVDKLEYSSITPGITRTSMYYCDPMASGQKGRLEKNHEYIRYVIPKGTSLNPFSQEDFNLLMNHINSTKRPSLQNRSPYELIDHDDEDMRKLIKLMSLAEIPADAVNLTKSLLKNERS